MAVGAGVGTTEGPALGTTEGAAVGTADDGTALGTAEGVNVGTSEGEDVVAVTAIYATTKRIQLRNKINIVRTTSRRIYMK